MHKLKKASLTNISITVHSTSSQLKYAGWTALKRGVRINFDLENSPLQIRTDSVVGSNERVAVLFYDAKEDSAGGFALFFKSPPQYILGWCGVSNTNFPTDLPTETDKIWKLTLTRTSDVRLMIHCNNKEVLNLVLSDTTCSNYDTWSTYWSRDVEKIEFHETDTASGYYRAGYQYVPKNVPIRIKILPLG